MSKGDWKFSTISWLMLYIPMLHFKVYYQTEQRFLSKVRCLQAAESWGPEAIRSQNTFSRPSACAALSAEHWLLLPCIKWTCEQETGITLIFPSSRNQNLLPFKNRFGVWKGKRPSLSIHSWGPTWDWGVCSAQDSKPFLQLHQSRLPSTPWKAAAFWPLFHILTFGCNQRF